MLDNVQVKKLILSLKEIRGGVPQLLFVDEIRMRSMFLLKMAIMNYKIRGGNSDEVDFIINSPGGIPDEAYRIIRTLRKNFGIVNIIVPFWAKSAATLLALGGTKIVMDEFGEFGPLDAQMGKVRDDSPDLDWESALNDEQSVQIIEYHFKTMYESMFLQIYEHDKINISKNELSKQLMDNLSRFYEPLLKQIDPYRLGDKRRTLDIGAQYAQRILGTYGQLETNEEIKRVTDFFVDACPDHGYVIDYDLLKLLLPNVTTSSDFGGKHYEIILSAISNMFIGGDLRTLKYVGFVEEEEEEDEEEEVNDNNDEKTLLDYTDNAIIAENEANTQISTEHEEEQERDDIV